VSKTKTETAETEAAETEARTLPADRTVLVLPDTETLGQEATEALYHASGYRCARCRAEARTAHRDGALRLTVQHRPGCHANGRAAARVGRAYGQEAA
jgi:hypothetical protein